MRATRRTRLSSTIGVLPFHIPCTARSTLRVRASSLTGLPDKELRYHSLLRSRVILTLYVAALRRPVAPILQALLRSAIRE